MKPKRKRIPLHEVIRKSLYTSGKIFINDNPPAQIEVVDKDKVILKYHTLDE